MSIFDGMDGDFSAELDDLGIDDDLDGWGGDLGDVAAADVPGAEIPLPDPFDDSLSPETEGVLDSTDALMADASATYAEVAATEGLTPDLPAPGAEQAAASIDAAMNADAEQAQHLAGFLQGDTYVQDVKNDVAESQAEVQQADATSAALADAEYRAWEADRAAAAAASEVAESQRERGV